MFAVVHWTTTALVIAQSDDTFPNYSTPDAAEARDADGPDPQYADGSPGQYVLIGSQWPQPGGPGTPIQIQALMLVTTTITSRMPGLTGSSATIRRRQCGPRSDAIAIITLILS